MFHLHVLDRDGRLLASASQSAGGQLVVVGDMRAWREAAAELVPILTEAAATLDPEPALFSPCHPITLSPRHPHARDF